MIERKKIKEIKKNKYKENVFIKKYDSEKEKKGRNNERKIE